MTTLQIHDPASTSLSDMDLKALEPYVGKEITFAGIVDLPCYVIIMSYNVEEDAVYVDSPMCI